MIGWTDVNSVAASHGVMEIDLIGNKMIYLALSDLNINLPDVYRHWDADSEYYAGGDALVAALAAGWLLGEMVHYEEHWLDSGIRYINVYHFELRRGRQYRIMHVIGNPFIEQLIGYAALMVLPLEAASRTDHLSESL